MSSCCKCGWCDQEMELYEGWKLQGESGIPVRFCSSTCLIHYVVRLNPLEEGKSCTPPKNDPTGNKLGKQILECGKKCCG